MKKWMSLFPLILSLLSSFAQAMDNDPKSIEENRRSKTVSSSLSSSSSSSASTSAPINGHPDHAVPAPSMSGSTTVPCIPNTTQTGVETKQHGERRNDLNFASIPPGINDPWKIVSQCDGINYLCPRLRAKSWQLAHVIEHPRAFFPRKAFSDTHFAYTNNNNHTIYIYSIATGELIYTLTGHTGKIETVLFSPDGQYIATESRDLTARIWSTETGKCLHTLQDPNYLICAIAFSPDSKSIATGAVRGGVRIWDIATGAITQSIPHYPDRPNRYLVPVIAFSSHGRYIAYNAFRNALHLYDMHTSRYLHALPAEEDQVIFSPNNKHLVTEKYNSQKSNTIRIWDISTGKCLHTFAHHKGISLSPDGNTLVTVQQEMNGKYFRGKNARIVDINTGHCIKTLEIPEKNIISASLSHDGHHIVTLEGGNVKARIWDAHTGQCLHTINFGGLSLSSPAIRFSPNDKHIIVLSWWGGKTHIFKSSFNIRALTLEQTKFITLCETATAQRKMPLWLMAKKSNQNLASMQAIFNSFNQETQNLMRKTYGLSDTAPILSSDNKQLPSWRHIVQKYPAPLIVASGTIIAGLIAYYYPKKINT